MTTMQFNGIRCPQCKMKPLTADFLKQYEDGSIRIRCTTCAYEFNITLKQKAPKKSPKKKPQVTKKNKKE